MHTRRNRRSAARVRTVICAPLILVLVLLAACGSGNETPTAAVDAGTPSGAMIVDAASAASVSTPVAQAGETPCGPTAQCALDPSTLFSPLTTTLDAAAVVAAAPTASSADVSFADVSIADLSPVTTTSRLPKEVARWALTEGSRRIADFRLDSDGITAYLTDFDESTHDDYRLHVFDTQRGEVVKTLAVSGDRLTHDPVMGRLYIAPEVAPADGVPRVTVFDTASRTIVGTLEGSRVAADPAHGRLYVGEEVSYYGEAERGVRLHDAATLALLREGELAGAPLYNPLRDELVIVNYSAFTADPATLSLREDLFPEISSAEIRACNGCPAIEDAYYFEAAGQLLFVNAILSTGAGAGITPKPTVLDAATLSPVRDAPTLGATCSSLPFLRALHDGVSLVHDHYSRYLVHNNLKALDANGLTLAYRDGLRGPIENPSTNTGYVQESASATWVIDRADLDLLGVVPSYCFFARADDGRLFATDGARQALVLLRETGGVSIAPMPAPVELAGSRIGELLVSPNWLEDGRLYAIVWMPGGAGQALLRSSDRGASWQRLDGLPLPSDAQLVAALSPAFAADGTLYAAGSRDESAGFGVWRSQDHGDTWQPLWRGLRDLRVDELVLSPRFAADSTLLAYAPYTRIRPWEDGYSIQRSDDGGLNWTRVITAEYRDLLPAPSVYLPITETVNLPVRKPYFVDPVMFEVEGTGWTTATGAIGAEETPVATISAPGADPLAEIYVVTEAGVYRTLDQGKSWSAWQDARLESLTWESGISAAAATPADASGDWSLLLGAADGALWTLDPATMTWTDVADVSGESAQPAQETPSPEASTPSSSSAVPPVSTTTTAPVTATAIAQPLGEPATGWFAPAGIFGDRWQRDTELQQALGFARTAEPAPVPAAYQPFENGAMVWLGDGPRILVVANDQSWASWPDTFVEGEAERDPNLYTPGELLQPVRGFGKLWRTEQSVRDQLGWATAVEKGETALVQEFERGLVVWAGNRVIVLVETPDGRSWR